MIRLRVLGSSDLRGSDEETILSVLSQPKRLTLLTYLALSATGGFTRRDHLLGLFWPDSEPDKARASLRRSLSFLRKSLGLGVIVTRGDEEVGIAADALECDAVLFESALDRGDRESALEMFESPLMGGLTFSDAPDLERWLDDTRSRLARRAVEAAASLGDDAAGAGDLKAATSWARKALELDPYSDFAIRRLISLIGRSGDREGALRSYDEFSARLSADLDLEPAAETAELIASIRSAPSSGAMRIEAPRAMVARSAREVVPTDARSPQGSVPLMVRRTVLSLAAATVIIVLWGSFRQPASLAELRYRMVEGAAQERSLRSGRRFALSPDGSRLVYVGAESARLWVRPRAQLDASPLSGTAGAGSPFFSPDGERVGFFARGELRVASFDGDPVVRVSDALDSSAGASWGPDGYVYAGMDGFGGLVRLAPAPGAEIQPFTTLNHEQRETDHVWPEALPNGEGVLFTVQRGAVGGGSTSIAVADVQTGVHRILVDGLFPRYAASGHLLYVTADRRLMVAPFDARSMELTGAATVVDESLRLGFRGAADVAVSGEGTLIYATGPGPEARDLVWVTRDGSVEPVDPGWRGSFDSPTLSPDGSMLVVAVSGPSGADLWVKNLADGSRHKITVDGGTSRYPAWTPDGRSLTYYSNALGASGLWTKPVDGSAHAVLQLTRPRELAESLWSPDGAWLIYRTSNVPRPTSDGSARRAAGAADILAMRPGVDEEPRGLATTEYTEVAPSLSPDGRWLAFSSHRSGREEVYVVPFPEADQARWSISPGGGSEPVWSHSGEELFYRAHGSLLAVEVETTPTFSVGRTTVLFDTGAYVISGLHPSYDVSLDDSRFLMVRTGLAQEGDVIVVENWAPGQVPGATPQRSDWRRPSR